MFHPSAGSCMTTSRAMQCRVDERPNEKVDWARLIAAVAGSGDRDAFERLFAHFAPRVKSLMMKNGAPAEVAEEIAQETMLLVWRKAAQFDPSTSGAAAWVFTIARNLRVDGIRRSRPAVSLQDMREDAFADATARADERLQSEQDHQRVQRALASLPAEQYQAVWQSYYEKKSHGEIAAESDMPLGTVKSRLRLALRHLRKILDDDR